MANMSHLSEDVLVEIMTRVPFKYVSRCKCVSKTWFSLLSSPSFLDLYISHHLSHYKALFLFLSPHHLILSFNTSTLPHHLLLPSAEQNSLMIRAANLCGSSNGFLLCSTDRYTSGLGYYIYDPLTKECIIHVPPSPRERKGNIYAVGFVCNPDDGKFRVILIQSCSGFKLECFFSERWEWEVINTTFDHGPRRSLPPHCLLGKAFQGKLYFMACARILVFDPFENTYGTISYPEDAKPMNIISFGYLGQSCGSLRIADIGLDDVRVWELKDGDGWHLLHKIILSTDLPARFRANHFKRVGGFHPYDGDIVYLCSYVEGIFVANIRTNRFEAVPGYEICDVSPFQLELLL
ncbi:hypothetical protein RIF29_12343 [Crotalaria pallida]|uniref:F-box domain-containing protein n=1 Tax=Crotalaria pallida TaxID=3830 RepID=A0AAN9IN52_CROPI